MASSGEAVFTDKKHSFMKWECFVGVGRGWARPNVVLILIPDVLKSGHCFWKVLADPGKGIVQTGSGNGWRQGAYFPIPNIIKLLLFS